MSDFTKVVSIIVLVAVTVSSAREMAPVMNHEGRDAVTGSFIVKLKDGLNSDDTIVAQSLSMESESAESVDLTDKLTHRHNFKKFKGFAVENMTSENVHMLRKNPTIKWIEQEELVHAESVSSWGLDRVDQRGGFLDDAFATIGTGSDVDVFVVDSGVYIDHSDFRGRAELGIDFVNGDTSSNACFKHGTGCAGIVGGTEYGVAKGVNIISVRILDCQGSGRVSTLVDALEWIGDHKTRPSIVSMSIGASGSQTIDDAVQELIDEGTTVVVAAGNADIDACTRSPARVTQAITVGSTSDSDERSYFSNYGSCVDIFAPGSAVETTTTGSTTAIESMYGTSFSVPYVSGALAILLSLNPNKTPTNLKDDILNYATKDAISDVGTGSPNSLLYIGQDIIEATPEPPVTTTTPKAPVTTTTPKAPVTTTTPKEPLSTTTTPKEPLSTTTTPKEPLSTTTTPKEPLSTTATPKEPLSTTATPNEPLSTTTTPKAPLSTTTTPKAPASTTTTMAPDTQPICKKMAPCKRLKVLSASITKYTGTMTDNDEDDEDEDDVELETAAISNAQLINDEVFNAADMPDISLDE